MISLLFNSCFITILDEMETGRANPIFDIFRPEGIRIGLEGKVIFQ